MLLFVSPLALKKMILNIFMTNLTVVVNTQSQDSLMLKQRDERQPKLFRMEEKDAKPRKWKKTVRYLNGQSEFADYDGLTVMAAARPATTVPKHGHAQPSANKQTAEGRKK